MRYHQVVIFSFPQDIARKNIGIEFIDESIMDMIAKNRAYIED